MITRRDFIKFLGTLGSVTLTPLHRIRNWEISQVYQVGSDTGELYAGFLLLPDSAPLPQYVIPPALPDLDRCGMVEGDFASAHYAQTEYFDEFPIQKIKVYFPIYTLNWIQSELTQGKVEVVYDEIGNLHYISIPFGFNDQLHGTWITIVSISIRPNFPRPYPIWKSDPVEPDGPALIPSKVDYLPSDGVHIASQMGFACYWIEQDTLYTLIADPSPQGLNARQLASLLTKI